MDPNEVLIKFVPGSPNNYTRMTDETLTKLFNAQKSEADQGKRQDLARQFQIRLLKEAYVAPLYWATRTTSVPSNLRGWKVPPNFSLWLDLADVWLKK
jgi:ABC-type transport system substrate-binding protein